METTDALLIVPAEQEDPFKGHEATAAEANAYKEKGELPERVKAGEAKPKPRDGGGRFTKVLANWKEDSAYRQAVLEGAVEPNDEMDPETWRAARAAQIQRGAVKITAPQPEPEKTAATNEAAKTSGGEQKQDEQKQPVENRVLPPEHPHWQRDKVARSSYRDFDATVNSVPFAVSTFTGLAIAELNNSADVLYSLSKHPELLAELDILPPNRRVTELGKISNILAYGTPTAPSEEKPAPKAAEKFTPPEPVGARQTSKAFDVNDENMPADEWAKKRNEQIRKRQG